MDSGAIEIKSVIRRMRGGSQACLVQVEDGQFYIAKFAGNPQGTRSLINEWIAHRLFERVGVSTPPVRILRLSETIARGAALSFEVGKRSVPVEPGLHFGSQCPRDPTTTALFDFLPKRLVHRVLNLEDFGRAFVLDKMLSNTDSRQAIFVRERPRRGNSLAFRAYMIDHGMAFGGDRWELLDTPLHGLYWNRDVYSMINMRVICEDTLRLFAHMSDADLSSAFDDIPGPWLSERDRDDFRRLLSQVQRRRAGLGALVLRHLESLQLPVSGGKVFDSILAGPADPGEPRETTGLDSFDSVGSREFDLLVNPSI